MGILLTIFGIVCYIVIATLIKIDIFEDRNISKQLAESKPKRIWALIIALTWPISMPILLVIGGILILFEGVKDGKTTNRKK